MEEQLYSVWVKQPDGWMWTGNYPRKAADDGRAYWELQHGVPCRIHPRHKNTKKDVIKG